MTRCAPSPEASGWRWAYNYEGYATAEIAALLGVREATVRTWLHRARLKLKELLKEAWDNDEL